MAYTNSMSVFVKSTLAPKPKTKDIKPVSLVLAAILLVMVVAQLFTYEDFPGVVTGFWLSDDAGLSHVLAALIVVAEVSALPFLLAMRLSPLMRVLSMVSGWIAIGFWVFIAIWLNVTMTAMSSAGILGATIEFPVGRWVIWFTLALAVLTAWASWGMWPVKPVKKSRLKRN